MAIWSRSTARSSGAGLLFPGALSGGAPSSKRYSVALILPFSELRINAMRRKLSFSCPLARAAAMMVRRSSTLSDSAARRSWGSKRSLWSLLAIDGDFAMQREACVYIRLLLRVDSLTNLSVSEFTIHNSMEAIAQESRHSVAHVWHMRDRVSTRCGPKTRYRRRSSS